MFQKQRRQKTMVLNIGRGVFKTAVDTGAVTVAIVRRICKVFHVSWQNPQDRQRHDTRFQISEAWYWHPQLARASLVVFVRGGAESFVGSSSVTLMLRLRLRTHSVRNVSLFVCSQLFRGIYDVEEESVCS